MNEKVTVTNAFSLSMVAEEKVEWHLLNVEEISLKRARQIVRNAAEVTSAVGHESTANFISKVLGVPIPENRRMINLRNDEPLLVFQLMQRLPEGKILTEEEIKQVPFRIFIVTLWSSGDKKTQIDASEALHSCM